MSKFHKALMFFIIVGIWFIWGIFVVKDAYGDELHPSIRNYDTPLVCKPVIITDGIVSIGKPDTWVVLTWARLEALDKNRMTFSTEDGPFVIPATGYICEFAGRSSTPKPVASE